MEGSAGTPENLPPKGTSTPPETPKEATDLSTKILICIEIVLVCVMSLGVLLAVLYMGLWIFAGRHYHGCHERFVQTLELVDKNWRVGTLGIICIFFRPIRRFLLNLKKGPLGMEVEQTPPIPANQEDLKKD